MSPATQQKRNPIKVFHACCVLTNEAKNFFEKYVFLFSAVRLVHIVCNCICIRCDQAMSIFLVIALQLVIVSHIRAFF